MGKDKEFPRPEQVIYMCMGDKCKKHGNKEHKKLLSDMIKDAGLKNKVEIIKVECTDRCKFAPVMSIQPNNVWLHDVSFEELKQIFETYIAK